MRVPSAVPARFVRCAIVLRGAQYKYEHCVGLFNNWAVRSGMETLTEWVRGGTSVLSNVELRPLTEENGDVRMPTPETICDFLLQVRMRRERAGIRTSELTDEPRRADEL